MTRIISTEEIEANLTMTDCLSALEGMFEELGEDRAVTNSREDMHTPVPDPPEEADESAYYALKTMSGVIPNFGVGAIRINSDIVHWPTRHGTQVKDKVPAADGRYTGLVLLFSVNTGEPLAIFPDGFVQSFRVSGTSALGAKYLANEDVSKLGLLGTGQQAGHHFLALNAVREFETVDVYSPTEAHRESFAEERDAAFDVEVNAVDSPKAVFEAADVVQAATNSMTPVFEADWIEAGTHVGAIKIPEEIPDSFLDPSVVLDGDIFEAVGQSWPRTVQQEEYGDYLNKRVLPTKNTNHYVVEADRPPRVLEHKKSGVPEWWADVPGLDRIVTGKAPGRTSTDGRTLFYNRGLGIQFAALGKVIYDMAEADDLGEVLPTELLTQEYHP